MSAHVSPNGGGGGSLALGRLGAKAESPSPRQEGPGLVWGALYVLIPGQYSFLCWER